ncbi:hypothetical protein Z517_08129 [Fonsecaea pedrosoi CBS 271.37]|uniref:Beta-lactamase-related domain-containing protein n=1 Tax=Fonsecaea pedrosoi CBS 271.37 TaxID=1442368 RepID=A0A0D2H0R9_9EURO|nr:uncharacterized protein Z517_08129 [Fonsecaea pedrosoi CBS 271.37]KIW78294.1 hypothetical protein Z517_08129 [Fonsecaea pedrosoi CBS 271.37]
MADFEAILANSTDPAQNAVHACILAAVDKTGKQLYFKAAGHPNVDDPTNRVDPDATLWIASCTKLIGTVAALQCVERDQVGLDDPVDKILPELAAPEVFSPPPKEGGESLEGSQRFVTQPATNKITLRNLLCHNSGHAYDFMDPLLVAWRASRGEGAVSLSALVAKAHTIPLLYQPGEGWSYGGGIDDFFHLPTSPSLPTAFTDSSLKMGKWAGEIVARLNNTSLEDYLQEHIFKPLGIHSTTFRLERHPEIQARLMPTAERNADGTFKMSQKMWPDEAPEDCAGAGLYSTATDYLAVLGDLIRDEPRLLKRETIEKNMFAPQFAPGSPSLAALLGNTAIIAAMTGAANLTGGINWGLGGLYMEDDIGVHRKGTLTWGGLPNLVWIMNRDRGVAALYATQLIPPADPKNIALANHFFDEVFRLGATQG